MKNVITLDIESFYSKTYSLSKMTTQEYILDPQFETIGVGVIVDGERLWCSGTHAQIQKFLNQFDWAKSALLAQNCLTGDHEVRTPEGWVRLDMLKDEQQVLQWDPITNKSSYVIPRAVIRKQHIGTMLKWDTSFHKGIYTPDHRMYYKTPSSDEWKVGTALEVSKMGANNVYVPMAGEYEVGTPLEITEPMARLMEAIRADGHITSAGRVRFKFTKQRKIERLRALLDSMGVAYREYQATNPVCTAFDLDRCSLLEYVVETLTTSGSKGYGPWALRMSIDARKALLDEVQYWDGYVADNLRGKGTNRKTVLHTANKTDALWLYEMAISVGLCAKVQYDLPNTRGWSKPDSVLHMVSIRTKSKVKTLVAPETMDYDGMVYCVNVPTGAFVVRREGVVWSTGNCMFDAAILAWHYGIYPMILLDTLAMSRALYPHQKSHSLAKQAERHGIGEKGTEVLNALGKRRADFTPDELSRYGDYCLNDCDLTLELAKLYLPRFKKSELKLIDSTLRMYTEPAFVLDEDKLRLHAANLKTLEGIALTRVQGILNLDPSSSLEDIKRLLASNQKFAKVLESFDVEPPMKLSATTGKMAYAFAKTDKEFTALEEHENEQVQALVKARLGTKSTIEETRTQRLIDCAQMAQEVPIAMRYYGAWTGRWSADASGATNFQNMPRTSPIKNAICAPSGYMVCGADLSNIELRLGLWLAGQNDKVELIRAGRDLYKDLAAKVNGVPYDEVPKDMRQTYKVVQLSSIYQTGPARLKETLRIMAKQEFDLEEAKKMIYAYRDDNKDVVQAWDDCHHALMSISEKRTGDITLFRGLVKWDWDVQGFLLPSGLHLQMPNLRVELNEAGKKQFVFDGAYGSEKTYGGKLFQGLTQALARCIIAEGWLRINKRYTIKLSVHDSLYWLAPEGEAQESLDWGIEQMTAPISWCEDLPLGAEGGFGPTLGDA